MRAYEQGDNFAHVKTVDPKDVTRIVMGYLRLPHRTTSITTPVNFTGAVVRMLRTDWIRAFQLFEQAEMDPDLPTSIRIDSRLLRAYCLERQDKSGLTLVDLALQLNPNAIWTLKYAVMVRLSAAHRVFGQANAGLQIAQIARDIPALLRRLNAGADPQDPWIMSVQSALDLLGNIH